MAIRGGKIFLPIAIVRNKLIFIAYAVICDKVRLFNDNSI